jgi:hypothetical protein
MKNEKEIYLLDWGNDKELVGVFRGSNLCQIANTGKSILLDYLRDELKRCDNNKITIHILESYDELQKLREEMYGSSDKFRIIV